MIEKPTKAMSKRQRRASANPPSNSDEMANRTPRAAADYLFDFNTKHFGNLNQGGEGRVLSFSGDDVSHGGWIEPCVVCNRTIVRVPLSDESGDIRSDDVTRFHYVF